MSGETTGRNQPGEIETVPWRRTHILTYSTSSTLIYYLHSSWRRNKGSRNLVKWTKISPIFLAVRLKSDWFPIVSIISMFYWDIVSISDLIFNCLWVAEQEAVGADLHDRVGAVCGAAACRPPALLWAGRPMTPSVSSSPPPPPSHTTHHTDIDTQQKPATQTQGSGSSSFAEQKKLMSFFSMLANGKWEAGRLCVVAYLQGSFKCQT